MRPRHFLSYACSVLFLLWLTASCWRAFNQIPTAFWATLGVLLTSCLTISVIAIVAIKVYSLWITDSGGGMLPFKFEWKEQPTTAASRARKENVD